MPSATTVAAALQVISLLRQPAVGGNPLVPNVGMADPHPHVYNDTLVLYAGHDAGGPNSSTWDMPDWRIWTSDNLIDWRLERVLRPDQGPLAAWNISECFATDGAKRCAITSASSGDASSGRGGGGGRLNTAGANECWYYFYFSNHSTDIGVLRSRNPTGPWEDPLQAPLFPAGTTDKTQYDPTVLTDKDGSAYLVWGRTHNKSLPLSPGCAANPHCRRAGQASYHIARLTEDMIHLAELPRLIVFGGAMVWRQQHVLPPTPLLPASCVLHPRVYVHLVCLSLTRSFVSRLWLVVVQPHADKPTLHRHGDRYYISAGDEYSIASSVYGPYTYAGKTGGGGGHGRFFQARPVLEACVN